MYLVTGTDGAVPRPVASSDPWGTFETQHQRNVLLGITDREKATGFALAAQGADLEPVLAFTPAQLLAWLRSQPCDLIVVHPRLIEAAGRPWEFLDALRSCGCPVLVLGAEPSRRAGSVTAAMEVIRGATRLLPVREEAERVSWGPLELHPSRRQAWWRSEPLQLTPAQFRILTVLVDAAGALVTNQQLARRVWGSEGQFDGQRIFAHIRRIRKKIESDPANPRFLLTIRGEGFRLAV